MCNKAYSSKSLVEIPGNLSYRKRYSSVQCQQHSNPATNRCTGSRQRSATCLDLTTRSSTILATRSVQLGGTPPSAKPWKGEGAGVFEIVEDHRGDTYRAVYTVRFEKAIYVLHCFQKKSPSGIRTAKTDIDLIHARLQLAQKDYEANYE